MSDFLEQFEYNAEGWNGPYNSNWEKLNDLLGNVWDADVIPGVSPLDDIGDTLTIEELTDNSGGTAANEIVAISGSGADSDINDNFASLAQEVNHTKDDLETIRDKVDDLLAKLRITGGIGVLADNP